MTLMLGRIYYGEEECVQSEIERNEVYQKFASDAERTYEELEKRMTEDVSKLEHYKSLVRAMLRRKGELAFVEGFKMGAMAREDMT